MKLKFDLVCSSGQVPGQLVKQGRKTSDGLQKAQLFYNLKILYIIQNLESLSGKRRLWMNIEIKYRLKFVK